MIRSADDCNLHWLKRRGGGGGGGRCVKHYKLVTLYNITNLCMFTCPLVKYLREEDGGRHTCMMAWTQGMELVVG